MVGMRRARGAVLAGAATVALVAPLAVGGAAQAALSSRDLRRAQEAGVDRFPTPKLGWYGCYQIAQCATVRLPLDYDRPDGATTEVAVLRVPARDQAHRIGSLFLNPGGPSGSATQFALFAPYFLGQQVLDRFDVVGVDPRGVGASEQVRCFDSHRQQTRVLGPLVERAFPVGARQEAAAVRAARAVGKACSSTGRPLTAAMSTAEVARDMDVVRRAVGDRQLSYLGFSYGSYLGQVYANMFPDRVRAVAIDGVLDPLAWTGNPSTRSVPSTERLRSGQGAYRALREILLRCDRAGRQLCRFAPGDPVANYDLVARRLKASPLVFQDPASGQTFRFTYADLVGSTLGALYSPDGYRAITDNLADLIILTEPPAAAASAGVSATRVQAQAALSRRVQAQREQARAAGRFDFPYDNSFEAFYAVLCTDGLNPADAAAWPRAADRAERHAKYFGRLWTWASVQCANRTWTARDEDAYRGPFTQRTSAPVLVVGNLWDPATNYQGAVTAARLLPNSRLLTSDSWGHTAYGSSACVDRTVERYLLTQAAPTEGARCTGDVQPFTQQDRQQELRVAGSGRARPPIVPLLPPSHLG